MHLRRRRRFVTTAVVLAVTACALTGCAGLFDRYPNAQGPADLAGTWTHASSRLTLHGDGTFEMTDMPTWVTRGDTSAPVDPGTPATVSCTGTWDLQVDVQNFHLSSPTPDCGGGGFATGRQGEMTIAFGIDGGSGDPRCWELVRVGSDLEPRGREGCRQYH